MSSLWFLFTIFCCVVVWFNTKKYYERVVKDIMKVWFDYKDDRY